MLIHLHIVNFAIVSQLDLVFDAGMTVITGETGAGKSIMLDALGLALGDRAESGVLADGQERAEIHASFDIRDNPDASGWLNERELASDPGHECILRRVLSRDGRSRAYINNQPCTVQDLKSLGELLIDIHSQHEHQSLLKRDTHRRLLDDYGGHGADSLLISGLYDRLHSAEKQFQALKHAGQEQSAQLQLLTYQAEELDALDLQQGEVQSLEEELKRLVNAESALENCQQVLDMLTDADATDSGASLLEALDRAIHKVESLDDSQLAGALELLQSGRIQLQEAAYDIQQFADDYLVDPERLKVVEERLDKIHEIARKHHIQPDKIIELQTSIRTELDRLADIDTTLDDLANQIDNLKSEYTSAAGQLSGKRKASAQRLAKAVTKGLRSLGMKDATLAVALTPLPNTYARYGSEDIEFLISTIAEQSKRPLHRVASGGELSRISLSIQVVTANTTRVPTLVFDEVDVGIGGGVAEVVGKMLRQLGKQGQILCVTHLPQVAAQGHHHLQVLRQSRSKKTVTEIVPLTGEQRVAEIARMLGGLELTSQSMAHAQEMFDAGQSS